MIYSGSYFYNNTSGTINNPQLVTTVATRSHTASITYNLGDTSTYIYDNLLENEKFIKEKNFTYVDENDLYLTKNNERVIVKKYSNGFSVIKDNEYKNTQNVLQYVDKLGYTINTNAIPMLFLVKKIANLKDKLKII
jgi:K+ transporter